MKLNRRDLRRLIESVINEDKFDDAFADMSGAFAADDDKSKYAASSKEATPDFVKKVVAGAKEAVDKENLGSKKADAELNYFTNHGVSITKTDYIVETQDGEKISIPKNNVHESLSRGSLYRRRYYGRY